MVKTAIPGMDYAAAIRAVATLRRTEVNTFDGHAKRGSVSLVKRCLTLAVEYSTVLGMLQDEIRGSFDGKEGLAAALVPNDVTDATLSPTTAQRAVKCRAATRREGDLGERSLRLNLFESFAGH